MVEILKNNKIGACFFVGVKERRKKNNNNNNWDLISCPLVR